MEPVLITRCEVEASGGLCAPARPLGDILIPGKALDNGLLIASD